MTTSGCFTHWWAGLAAIPPDSNSAAYERLRRVWWDTTRFTGADAGRAHECVNPRHETFLAVGLFENFVLFSPADWVPAICEVAGTPIVPEAVTEVGWSYEWEKQYGRGHDPALKLCDVVVHYRCANGRRGIIVVETKNLKTILGPKDQPSYYLGIEDLIDHSDERQMIYCVDADVEAQVRDQLPANERTWGLITWQRLGGLQTALARQLPVDEPLRTFIAGAIQHQFCVRNIRPDRLAAPYLAREPSMCDVDRLPKDERQRVADREQMHWRLRRG